MDWKSFVKPDWKKVVLTVVIFAVATYLYSGWTVTHLADAVVYGFPLDFYFLGTYPCLIDGPQCPDTPSISYISLAVDIIFAYVIACALLTYMPKRRKG